MANSYFFTGFPGFICTSLIKRLIESEYDINYFYLLVLPSLKGKAENEINRITNEKKISPKKFILIEGDITKRNLGIGPELNEQLSKKITHVFHLAAIYDLAVPKRLAYDVNVTGTNQVNDWILNLHTIQRYIYFSTAYVSGTREGRIVETELEANQTFKNHYEQTKFEAEKLVRSVIDKVPTTIIRPGVVKGNSETGETVKFDGPYFMLNMFENLRFLPIIPYLGTGAAEGNFVPIDYILKATIYLGHSDIGVGKTYHLTDPSPYTMKEVYKMLMVQYLGKKPVGKIPVWLAKASLTIPGIRKRLKVEKEALDYFTCLTTYDCTQAQLDLEGSGIECPDFKETLESMTVFYEKHKNDVEKHIEIS
ncbi:NAD-dependent epimerase/dehydratase family protein [Aquibacillus halophilus]|uniref:NAD-dependent epimerase/dehydratase family protein n=1 Tax=Aquibacillus halophilus TaxID=930132 RepID=A0A6A8DDU5_9BACI|nr:SDR family oxidoreductase [Aquibacillus halophilus]MRH43865.1 NAD-dependent epimerase/dehydratase family protein [Aquibacillus halophilus]